jgi:iron complex outermembrane receptor protein
MKSWIRIACLAGAALGALQAGQAGAQTGAQTGTKPADTSTSVGEVVVTARRTAEPLQKAPVSVSAFSQKQLDALGAQNTTDLQGLVPNLNIAQGRGSSDATNIYIRGVGQPDALQTFDPAVGVYIDDVYYARIRGTMFDLLNLQDIEVLRGPQGTLYGKNTIGGALKIETVKPSQAFHAGADLSLGNYGLVDAKAYVSGPLTDTLAVGLSVLDDSHAGYVTDPINPSRTYNDQSTLAVRAQLAWTPVSNFRLDLAADYTSENPHMTVGQATNTLTNILGAPIYPISGQPKWDFKASTSPGLPNREPLHTGGVSAVMTWNVDSALTLKSITAARHLQYDDYIDIDGTTKSVGDVQVAVNQNQFSQELQAYYKQGPINAVAGLYYLHERVVSTQDAYANDYITNSFSFYTASTFLRTIGDALSTNSYAAYGNINYTVTDAFHLSAGLRYTDETKKYFFTTSTFSDNVLFNGTYTPHFTPDPKTWTNLSPSVSADWNVTHNAMVYARVAEGFQSGGFNGRSDSSSTGSAPYNPETIISYEVGAKTDWFGHKLRLNGDVFYNDYKNFQASVGGTEIINNVPTAVLTVLNAGSLNISGAELELVATPFKGLRLDSEIGYLDASYGAFNDSSYPGGTRKWETPAFSPKWTTRFGASYQWTLPNGGHVTLADQARYRSSMALAVDNANPNTHAHYLGLWQSGYWVDDAQLIFETPDRHYSLGLYAKNIGNVIYKTDAQNFQSVGGIMTAYYGDPATFNVTFRYRY